jgi:hypothetical protein
MSHSCRLFSISYKQLWAFHGDNAGSNPAGDAKQSQSLRFISPARRILRVYGANQTCFHTKPKQRTTPQDLRASPGANILWRAVKSSVSAILTDEFQAAFISQLCLKESPMSDPPKRNRLFPATDGERNSVTISANYDHLCAYGSKAPGRAMGVHGDACRGCCASCRSIL